MQTVDYQGYRAKPPIRDGDRRRLSPIFKGKKLLVDSVLLPYALARHRAVLKQPRVSDHTYTSFLRSPSQMRLLSGPILDWLNHPDPLTITLLACSNGAEAFTMASWLRQTAPGLDFRIRASDLHAQMVARAETGRYTRDEVLHGAYMTDAFLRATFDEDGDGFVVRPEIRQHVSFSQANLLDGDDLRAQFGQAPLVVAQNVLFHLAPDDASRAFGNLVKLLLPRGVLMVEGMDLDVRERVTSAHEFTPFTDDLRHIYDETRIHTPPRWWRHYWGTEPFLPFRRNRERRYATAFKRDVPR